MQGTIDVISSTGKGFRIVGQDKGAWFNKGKMLDEDLIAGLKKGDVIEFTAPDGKWVTALKKSDGTSPAQVSTAVKDVFSPKQPGATVAHHSDEKSNAVARGCAANSVLGSSYIVELLQGGCNEETVKNVRNFMEQVAEWVYSGKM